VHLPTVASFVVAIAACATDLRTRRVPNVLTFGGAAVAMGYHALMGGWPGLGTAAAGWAVGLAVFLPFFLLRGVGGGDVKLLAALGAWLGPGQVLMLALAAVIAGGVLGLIASWMHGYTRQAVANVWSLLRFWRSAGFKPHPDLTLDTPGVPRVPYSVPIAVGLAVTVWRS
jgi:prepilin peptidase CpaA